jgi:hypothetical protein
VNAEQLASYPLLHREPGNGIRDLVDQFLPMPAFLTMTST